VCVCVAFINLSPGTRSRVFVQGKSCKGGTDYEHWHRNGSGIGSEQLSLRRLNQTFHSGKVDIGCRGKKACRKIIKRSNDKNVFAHSATGFGFVRVN